MNRLKDVEVAIIGCGLTGASTFIQLVEYLKSGKYKNLSITIFDKSGKFGLGIAYSSLSSSTLCNTPISLMTVFDDDPVDFESWLIANRYKLDYEYPEIFPVNRDSFVPRKLFGKYIQYRFSEALELASNLNIQVDLKSEEVLNINQQNNQSFIETNMGSKSFDHVVLSLGHHVKNNFSHLKGNTKYFDSSNFESSIKHSVAAEDDVLIIGTSLGAIDAVLLLIEHNHKGKIFLTSKDGMFPAVRTKMIDSEIKYFNFDEVKEIQQGSPRVHIITQLKQALKNIYDDNKSLTDFMIFKHCGQEVLRSDIAQVSEEKIQWQYLIIQAISMIEHFWSLMNTEQKREFMQFELTYIVRYISSFPIQNATKIMQLLEQEKIAVLNDIVQVDLVDKKFLVQTQEQDSFQVSVVINTTGYEHNFEKISQSLVKNLFLSKKFNFNDFGSLKVDKKNLRVSKNNEKPCKTKFYAPASTSFGAFLVTNYVPTCVRHAKYIATDIINFNY